jgi:hypothetical protein
MSGGRAPVPLTEIEDFALDWSLPPSDRALSFSQTYRRLLRSSLRRILYELGDLGIFDQTEQGITLTRWGDVFVSAWLNFELRGSEETSQDSASQVSQLAPRVADFSRDS